MIEQPDDFKYYFTVKGVINELIFAPSSWDENSEIEYIRSDDYFGVIRSMGIPFEYVKDGSRIIREAMYGGGIESIIAVEVHRLNRITYQYELSFSGEIDLSEFDDENGITSVAIIEGGASKRIKAYEGVDYQISLVGSDVVKIILPGVALAESGEGIFLPFAEGDNDDYIPGSTVTTDDMGSGFARTRNVVQSNNYPDFTTSDSYFMVATRVLNIKSEVHVVGDYRSNFIGGSNPGAIFQVRDNTGGIIYQEVLGTGSRGSFNKTLNFSFNTVVDRRYFWFLTTTARGEVKLTDGEYKVSYSSISDQSECLGLKAVDLYNRIIQKMTPGTLAVSSLLSNKWKSLIFTSGDGIRQVSKAKINISFKDFFKTINSIEDAGFGIEKDKAVLEMSSYFARNFESANVGEVSKCKIKVAKNFIFNSFKVGYEDGNTDETNGKQEYNSGQVWYNTITRVKKEKDWISPTRADQFGIEYIRTQVIKEPTSDNSEDNKPFMIDCYQDGNVFRPILGNVYQSISGLTDPNTAYNLNLTPKKNLLRHGSYLRSMCYRMEDKYINFGSGDKNTELKTVINSVGVKENENILIGSLTEPYFIPFIAEITCKLPINIKDLLDNIPYGYITFVYNNVTLKGYILSVAVDIAKDKEQDFELLLTNNNDLLKLLENG